MPKLAGAAADGLLCSQAGLPPQAADKKFLDAYKKKFNVDPILYAPFTYDGANILIAAMQKANSADPAKYLPELQKISFTGATGPISFDAKGDRKDAEMTIFKLQGGKVVPVSIVKGGVSTPFAAAAPAPAAAAAPAAPATDTTQKGEAAKPAAAPAKEAVKGDAKPAETKKP